MLRADGGGNDDEKQKTGGFTEEELAGLSDAERAALEESDDDTAALRQIADGGEDDADAGADAKAAREAAEEKAAAAAKAAAEAASADKKRAAERVAELAAMSEEERKKAEAEDRAKADAAAVAKAKADADAKTKADEEARQRAADGAEEEPFAAAYRAEPPENYEQKVKDLDARKEAATAKFKDNAIEVDEMLAEHAAADAERRELEALKLKSEISAEQSEQQAEQRWRWEINRFVKSVLKHEGIDYRANRSLNAALDAEVKALGADEANKGWTGEQFLEEAHKRVKAQTGLGTKTTTAQDADAKARAAAAEADVKRKAELERQKKADENRNKLPKSVSQLPAAGGGDLGNEGEFAQLEGLDGMDLENAVARLTPEQQDRWARSNG